MDEMATGFQTYVNRIFLLLVFVFFGCNKNKELLTTIVPVTSKIEQNDSSINVKNLKSKQEISPDTTINSKLALVNYKTFPLFYTNSKSVKTFDRIRECPVVIFSNKSNTEYLIAYQYEGSTANSFSCFEIGYLKDDKELSKLNLHNTEEVFFKTESNLGLGVSVKELLITKGTNYELKKTEKESIISYRNVNFGTSTFLQRYNMPGYFMEYTLIDDKIIKIKFGFDYP
jgi:hypothetical protein